MCEGPFYTGFEGVSYFLFKFLKDLNQGNSIISFNDKGFVGIFGSLLLKRLNKKGPDHQHPSHDGGRYDL